MHSFEYLTIPPDFKRNIQCVCVKLQTHAFVFARMFSPLFFSKKPKSNYDFNFFCKPLSRHR